MDKTVFQTDHDILVTLVEAVKQNHNSVMTRIDSVKGDVKEIKDGTAAKLLELDMRIKAQEDQNLRLQPEKIADQVHLNSQWIHDFKISYRAIIGFSMAISSVITFLLSLLFKFKFL